jgi:hypothetical protein
MLSIFSGSKFTKLSLTICMAASLALTACGGGGGPGAAAAKAASGVPATTGVPAGKAPAAAVQLSVSSPQMLSSATATTVVTAVVVDATGQAVSGQSVNFGKGTDTSAYFTNLTGVTSANGVATATLNIGNNLSNRTISLSATAGAASAANTVAVTGTQIAVSGNTSMALNASSTLTIIVKDSTGVPVPGVTLTVASKNGNPVVLTPSTGVTDPTGQITAKVTATNAGTGSDVLTFTGAGVTQTQSLTISSASFAFTAPAAVAPATTPEILVNTATPVTIHWTNGGVAVPAASVVNFYTSRGAFAASGVAATSAAGDATATVTANSTGLTTFTASGPGGTPSTTLSVVFITNTATTVSAQANPGTVAVNAAGATVNQSVISVIVRDASLNLVKNAHVVFSQITDPSGGSLPANTAVTDVNGSASVNYIAGTISTGQNGVVIGATVDSVNGIALATPLTTTTALTVSAQTLFVRLLTDNKMYTAALPGNYMIQYTAAVTDAAGNPAIDGTVVRFSLRPKRPFPLPAVGATPAQPALVSFYKGTMMWFPDPLVAGAGVWAPGYLNAGVVTYGYTASCLSEDLNQNNVLDAGEDSNNNGRLDPTGFALVNATGTTVGGFATAQISYGKSLAYWAAFDLQANAGVVGNDPPAVTSVGILPGLVTDYNVKAVMPPGYISPFGASAGCNNPN